MCKYNLLSVFLVIITVNDYHYYTKAFRTFNESGVETILALENESIVIECKSDTIKYCRLMHPSGKRYTFSGPTTNARECSIKLKTTANDTGTWRCHIGREEVGEETTKLIQLRVVGQLAAVESNVTAIHGKPYILYCTTIKGLIPLKYCRFVPPSGLTFRIDFSYTESWPLLQRYYYPNNKSLEQGDCAVTIREVKDEDIGIWSCSASVDNQEYSDVIYFSVEDPYSQTYSISIIVIAIALVILLLVLGARKHRWFMGDNEERVETVEVRELQQIPAADLPSRAASTPEPERSIPIIVVDPPS